MTDPSPREVVHRALREQLGGYALGQLGEVEAAAVGAHLDGCTDCRAELAEIAPLAADLRLVDPARLPGPVTPPADLGARILAAVAAESVLRDARVRRTALRRRAVAVAAAVALAAGGVGVGLALDEPAAPAVTAVGPYEPVGVTTTGVTVTKVGLVPHTWGVEVKLVGSGFVAGGRYRTVVRSRDGRDLPAGEFLGTGTGQLTCNMQAAVLREAASGFSILDETGRPVVQSRFRRV